jgi:hypothetical protein
VRAHLHRRFRPTGDYWELQVGSTGTGGRVRVVERFVGSRTAAKVALAELAASVAPGVPRPYRPFAIGELVRLAGGVSALAARAGVHRKQVYRWLGYGLTVDQADELATAAGYHPSEIWPAWPAWA